MHKYLISIALIIGIILSSCTSHHNDNYKINIAINDGGNKTIYLAKRNGAEMINIDSITMTDGTAEFTGNIGLPELYYLMINETKFSLPVFIEQGKINVIADANSKQLPQVTGSISNDEYLAYNDSIRLFDQKRSDLYRKYNEASRNNDPELMKQIENEYNQFDSLVTDYLVQYIYNNPDKIISAYLLAGKTYLFELPELDSMVSNFNPNIDSSIYVKQLKEYVATLKRSSVGNQYIDFAFPDPTGNPIPLSSVVGNGKYVLVDFWASWCGPCRAENPNVVEAFNKYHEKGFDVFGVSFDKDHDKWVDAIKKDNLEWIQVSDLKYWNCEAGKLYGIRSIPQNILIDPDGIIIAKNLRGEELQNKLAEIFE